MKRNDIMDYNVLVSVKGNQHYGEDKEILELITEGKYYKKNDSFYVTYEESELTGMEGTTTTIKLEDGKVILQRSGENNSQLIFEEGQKHHGFYETMQGLCTVGVFSNNVDINLNEEGGNVSVKYHLDIQNNKIIKNNFHVKIRQRIIGY